MREKDHDKLEKTADFLDMMTRSERKAWERKKAEETDSNNEKQEKKLREEKHQEERKESNQNDEPIKEKLKPILEKDQENTQSIKSVKEEELQVGELGKTQHLLNLTSEIAVAVGENVQENLFEDRKKESSFNPITWIGLAIILCFGYFIYFVINSGYDKTTLLLIDSCFLLGMIFLFGISILCNRKWIKRFSILNLLVIIAFVAINILLFYDWNDEKENTKLEEPKKEILEKKQLSCTSNNESSTLELSIEGDKIIRIEQKLVFQDNAEKESIVAIFQEQEGLSNKVDDNTLTLTFDFTKLDVNQYKLSMRNYLEYYRKSSEFNYVKDDHLLYSLYKESELQNYQCTEKEES